MYKKGEKLIKIVKETQNKLKLKSKEELINLFKRYNDAFTYFAVFAWAPLTIEKILSENITARLKTIFPGLKEEDYKNDFNILTTLQKKSSTELEYENLLKVAAEYKKEGFSSNIGRKLRQIYKKFNYLGAIKVGWPYLTEPYNEEHYKVLIKEFAHGSPAKELASIRQKSVKAKRFYKNFIKKQGIDKKLIRDAKTLQEYIFFRTVRGEYIVRTMLYAKNLLTEIALRLGLNFNDIVWFTPQEIVEAMKTGKIPDFNPRKEGYSLIIREGQPILTVKKQRGIKEIIKQEPGIERKEGKIAIEEKEVEILKGQIAQSGMVKARVRIIKSAKDAGKLIEGDVLVTSMTTPDYILAIHRAAAIITDEGGVLCHAALVSREFGIPCIIGTGNATKVLNDGDVVEVDANTGTVKILEKAK